MKLFIEKHTNQRNPFNSASDNPPIQTEVLNFCECGHSELHHPWNKDCQHSFCTCKKFKEKNGKNSQ